MYIYPKRTRLLASDESTEMTHLRYMEAEVVPFFTSIIFYHT